MLLQLELLLELETTLPGWIVNRANVGKFVDHPNVEKSFIMKVIAREEDA